MNIKKDNKNILITGGSGFIGSNFLSHFINFQSGYKRNKYKIFFPSHKEFDITKLTQIEKYFNTFIPEVVINFAAYRDANSAETQREDIQGSVWKANVEGVENLSRVCQKCGCFLIHISTDMVFSGYADKPGPYDEKTKPEDRIQKLSWYGWTKAEAERRLKGNKKSAIIRIGNVTQPIYNPKLDYIGKTLYLYDHNKLYPLFHNQYLTLTFIPSIFQVIESIILNNRSGIFHVASKDILTPYEMGKYLIQKARGKRGVVKSSSIDDYLKHFPNRYPKYGGLLSKETEKILSINFLKWMEIVDYFIEISGSSFDK